MLLYIIFMPIASPHLTSNLASSKAHQLPFVLQYSRMLFRNTFTGVLQSSAACWMQARRLTVSTISLFFSCYSNGRSLSQSYVFSFSGTNPSPCKFVGTRLCPPALVLLMVYDKKVFYPLYFLRCTCMDELLCHLGSLGIGCYSGHHFMGALGYADDIILLAPFPSALRSLLEECEAFVLDMDVVFNAAKTQLICFRLNQWLNLGQFSFNFCDLPLQFTDKVKHLGHFYRYNLDDSEDIKRVSDDMCRKVTFLIHSFRSCDPVVKTFLFSSHCLSLYGVLSWKLSCPKLTSLKVTFNNILWKIWRLPRRCHMYTGILHCKAKVYSSALTLLETFNWVIFILGLKNKQKCPILSLSLQLHGTPTFLVC